MNIRKAIEQDIDAILELNRQMGEIHFERVPRCFAPIPEETHLLARCHRRRRSAVLQWRWWRARWRAF